MESGGGGDGDGGRNQSQASSTKSCKGYLMYNSELRSKGRCPRCIGLSSTLPSDSGQVLRRSEIKASKDGRRLIGFYYVCVGYGVYGNGKDITNDKERTEVPGCVGFEVLVEKRAQAVTPVVLRDEADAIRRKETQKRSPEPARPIHTAGRDDFYSRFRRNAGLVGSAVLVNMVKVGIHVKQGINEILDRRPK